MWYVNCWLRFQIAKNCHFVWQSHKLILCMSEMNMTAKEKSWSYSTLISYRYYVERMTWNIVYVWCGRIMLYTELYQQHFLQVYLQEASWSVAWSVVDSAAHVHPCGTHLHVHTQLSNPTWKIRRLCACECTVKSYEHTKVDLNSFPKRLSTVDLQFAIAK